MKNKTNLTIIATLSLLVLISFVSAAGIVSPYWESYPLEMHFGETKVAECTLQNTAGEGDITVKAELVEGNNIATLAQDTFTAPIGSSNTKIPVTITIPKDFDKSVQEIKLEVKTITPDAGGMITLGAGWTTSFNVILSEKPISRNVLFGIIIALISILIILVLIILIILLRRRTK